MSETEQQQIVERPSSATAASRNQHYGNQQHIHPNLDGTYAQVKVFAAPVTLPRPGSAPSMMRSTNNNNNTYSLHHQQQHNTKNGIAARSGWGGVRTPNMTSTAAFRTSSSSQSPSPNQQKRRRPQSAQQQQNVSPSAQQSRQQVKGQTHREHWTRNESPGRAASEAAKQFHEVYSGQPRDEARRNSSSRSPSPQASGRSMPAPINTNHEAYYRQYEHVNSRPSIPDAHIQVKLSRPTSSGSAAKFPVRGRALFGNADSNKRPSSAHSNSSSQNEGRANNNNNNNNAFPPRKIITAELTALRKKYHQANEANQNLAAANGGFGGFGNNYHSSSSSRSRNRNTNTVSTDPKKIRSQLDNIMMKINSNDSNNQTPVVDLGSGNNNNNQGTSPSRQNVHHHQVPAHIQHDNIVRRTSETARVMRREDKVAKENDRRIRNFRARALVQSATELQKAKQDTELKEISDKLVWAKMKRDAADQELYELKMRLASLS